MSAYEVPEWLAPTTLTTIFSATGLLDWKKMLRLKAQENMVGYGLTPRHQDVAWLLLEGCSRAEIASRLFISESTVKGHISAIFRLVFGEHHDSGNTALLLMHLIGWAE